MVTANPTWPRRCFAAAVVTCLSGCGNTWTPAEVAAPPAPEAEGAAGLAPPSALPSGGTALAPPPAGGSFADAPDTGGWVAPPPPPSTSSMGPPPPADMPMGGLSEQAFAIAQTLSPWPVPPPPDPTNAVADDPLAAELGHLLFFEPRYAGPLRVDSDLGAAGETEKVACVSCHWGEQLDDDRSRMTGVPVGADVHKRNALPLVDSAHYRWTNWGGRFASQWELSLAVAESPVIMNSSRLAVAHVIFDHHRARYEEVFGPIGADLSDTMRFPPEGKPGDPAWDSMDPMDQEVVNDVFVGFAKALHAYTRRLNSGEAPLDAFLRGEHGALSPEARRGLELFVGRARCVVCHLGPRLTDDRFHNTAMPPPRGEAAPDEGRFGDIPKLLASPFNVVSAYSDDPTTDLLSGLTDPPPPETLGQFRTPSLRNVSRTGPYMHAGQITDLREVVEVYDRGGLMPTVGRTDPLIVPLHLTDVEKRDLVMFLLSLDGEGVDHALTERPPELEGLDFEVPRAGWE